MNSIPQPYLLIAGTCPSYLAADARRHLQELWAKDLALHPEYLDDLTVAAPCVVGPVPADSVPVAADPRLARIRYVDLPPPATSFFKALLSLPRLVVDLWRAVGAARIVHAGIVGWPLPIGWIGIVLGRLRGRFVVVVVESAPWRVAPGSRPSMRQRLRSRVYESINRWMVGAADLSVFTQEDYRRSLLRHKTQRGHVIHASWIDEGHLLSPDQAQADWQRRCEPNQPLRCLFAGRLTDEKGLRTLLDAARLLASEPGAMGIDIDIAGDGPLRAECEAAIAAWPGAARPRLIGMTRYGPEFFSLVRQHDVVLVPSLSDEQPRIVYDAYAQAVPVFASDTGGLRSCVQAGVTGCIDPPGEPQKLAQRLAWALNHRRELASMGLAALETARGLTHRTMHRRRWVLLDAALAGSASASSSHA